MASVRQRNTSPELRVRTGLHRMGFRYRLHDPKLPGRPDIVLAQWRVVVFVHGCFWHRHKACPYATVPTTREEFWRAKFLANEARDRRTADSLAAMGWRVAVVWECETRTTSSLQDTLLRLSGWIRGNSGDSNSNLFF